MNGKPTLADIGSVRSNYLIGRAMKHYLVASILSTIVVQLNVIVDGIVVGQFVSPDALSAVNLYSPISLAIVSIGSLLGTGATVLAARYIGERNAEKTDRTLSTALFSLLVAGAAIAAAILLFRNRLTDLLCNEERISGYLTGYMMIMGCFGLFQMLSSFFGLAVEAEGQPRLVTFAQTISASANIVLDLLFVGAFGWGIEGAAWASVISSAVSTGFLLRHLVSAKCTLKFRPFRLFSFKSLSGNLKQGLPLIAGNLILMLLIFFLNRIILLKQGADGMFVMSVCINILTFGMLFSNGVGAMTLSIGGFLFGQKDFDGLRILVGKSLKFLLCIAILVLVVGEIFPSLLASLFGAKAEMLEYASFGIRVFVLIVPCFLFALFFANEYQMLGHLALPPVMIALFPVVLFPSMFIWSSAAGPENIWYAFPQAGVVVVIVALAGSLIVRRLSKDDLRPVTLLPRRSAQCLFNASIGADEPDISGLLDNMLVSASSRISDEKILFKIRLTAEELLINIFQHSHKAGEHYFVDVILTEDSGKLSLAIKDDGKAFNPMISDAEENQYGLKIVRYACADMDYKYMFGQNMTYLTWITNPETIEK